MTNAQKKTLQKLRVLFIDIDHVLHHYDSYYAQQFSVATACSFQALYPDLQRPLSHFSCIEMAKKSYAKTGRTTAIFAEMFPGIVSEMDLYIHHHGLMCKDEGYIDRRFQKGDIPYDQELWDLLGQVKNIGIEIYALTNGTQRYGEMVLGDRVHGHAHLFDGIFGMDSVDNPNMLDKRHGAFINDILDKTGLLKVFPETSKEGAKDFDHSHLGLIDDTHRNLRSASQLFNMQTVLQVNKRDWQGPSWSDFVVHDIKNYLRSVIVANTSEPSLTYRMV